MNSAHFIFALTILTNISMMHAGPATSTPIPSTPMSKDWVEINHEPLNPYITPDASENAKNLAEIVRSVWENKQACTRPCFKALPLIVRYANADPSMCNQSFPDKLKAVYKQYAITTQTENEFILDSKILIRELRANPNLRVAMNIQDAIMSADNIDTKIVLIEQFADQFAESQK